MPEDEEESTSNSHADALIGLLRQADPRRRFKPEDMMVSLPESVKPDSTFVIPFVPPADTPDASAAWKATFTWNGGRHANFQLEMVPGQSLFQDPAQDGWVSWTGPGTLVAWSDWESDSHGWGRCEVSPMVADPDDVLVKDEEITSDPLRWQTLATLCWLACSEEPEGFEYGTWS